MPIAAEPLGDDDTEHRDRGPLMAPRLALLLVSAVFTVYFTRQALTDVRAVASSYRHLSLDDELASTRSVLSAAGVDTALAAEPGELPSRISTVLATVLREGVTNILRHSRAERCAITITRNGDSVSIEIVDDGRGVATGIPSGSGVGNLATRVGAIGGELEAGPVDEKSYRR